jgi:hypothetical protein
VSFLFCLFCPPHSSFLPSFEIDRAWASLTDIGSMAAASKPQSTGEDGDSDFARFQRQRAEQAQRLKEQEEKRREREAQEVARQQERDEAARRLEQ